MRAGSRLALWGTAPSPPLFFRLLSHDLSANLPAGVAAGTVGAGGPARVHVHVSVPVAEQHEQRIHRHAGRRAQLTQDALGECARKADLGSVWTGEEVDHDARGRS